MLSVIYMCMCISMYDPYMCAGILHMCAYICVCRSKLISNACLDLLPVFMEIGSLVETGAS